MPWRSTDVCEQRWKFVVRAASGQEAMTALCREFGISRTTGYRWRRRFQQAGSLTAVVEHSRRPRHSPSQTDAPSEQRVVALRQKYAWGAKKLEVLLREQGRPLTVITIHRILKRHGLVRKKASHPPALQRFERSEPNQLWQMDGKGSIAEEKRPVTHCRFWTITAAMPWDSTVCVLLPRSKCIPAWCERWNATVCRRPC